MISLLGEILCVLQTMAAAIVNLFVLSINGLILLLGSTLALICAALPDMPDPLDAPDSGVLAWINWLVPVAPLVAFCTTALLLWAALMGVKVMLNWLRAF